MADIPPRLRYAAAPSIAAKHTRTNRLKSRGGIVSYLLQVQGNQPHFSPTTAAHNSATTPKNKAACPHNRWANPLGSATAQRVSPIANAPLDMTASPRAKSWN